jgi:Methyltransferase domain
MRHALMLTCAPVGQGERIFVHRHEQKSNKVYAPSFVAGTLVSDRQSSLVDELADVRGKLEPGDHMKLYEAGFFARGRIVEVGRLAAKSTIILGLGNRDAGRDDPIYSIAAYARGLEDAENNLRRFDLLDRVTLVQGDSAIQLTRLPAPFDVLFVDGDHSYEGVVRDLSALRGRVARGGLVLFHDYYHRANDSGEYGVRRAVDETAALLGISFRGRFGGIAMFVQT